MNIEDRNDITDRLEDNPNVAINRKLRQYLY